VEIANEPYGGVSARLAAVCVALDERDPATQEHCDRVCGLALELGMRCALSQRELGILRLAAGFHDVGKIGIPDSVLKKPAALNEDDWAIMKTHSARSERILLAAGLEDGAAVALAARHHHERYDGSGYPDGLTGDGIPILARIVAVVDAYDAMARMRHYGPPLPHAEIMDELRREQGRQHDPYLIDHFASIIDSSRFKARGKLSSSARRQGRSS